METYLPDAIGDGGTRTLRVAAATGMTSLFEPDPRRLALFNGFPEWGVVSDRVPMPTTRLDDVEQLTHLALVADAVYGSTDLAHRCLALLVDRGALTTSAPAEYLATV